MKTNKLEQELKSLKNLPVDHVFLATNKNQLLETIYNDPLVKVKEEISETEHTSFSFKVFSLKTVPAFLIIIALLLSTGTAYASQNSLPNEALYPVKLFTEKVEQTFTFDKVKKAEVAFKQAQKRIEELKKLEKTKPEDLKNTKVLAKTLKNYEDKINLGIKYIREMNETETKLVPINKYDRELTVSKKEVKELSKKANYKEMQEFKKATADMQNKQSEFVKTILDKAQNTNDLTSQLETIANDRIKVWEEELNSLPVQNIIMEPNSINLKEDAKEKIIIFKERVKKEIKTTLPMLQNELDTWANNLEKIPNQAKVESKEPIKTNTFTSDEIPTKETPETYIEDEDKTTNQKQEATSNSITPEQQAFKDQVMDLIRKGDTSGALDLINSNPDINEKMPIDLNSLLQ